MLGVGLDDPEDGVCEEELLECWVKESDGERLARAEAGVRTVDWLKDEGVVVVSWLLGKDWKLLLGVTLSGD